MAMMRGAIVKMAAAALLLPLFALSASRAAQAADAAPCQLHIVASVDIYTAPDGRITVPASVNGHILQFLVDTGGVSSSISQADSDEAGMTWNSGFSSVSKMGGAVSSRYVTVEKFGLGRLVGQNYRLDIDPHGINTLSPDAMRSFDVDIDFVHGKLNLISPDHCPGKVVYWTHDAYAVVPMEVLGDGHIRIPVAIDGKEMKALVDTGAMSSVIGVQKASSALGIDEKSAGVKIMDALDLGGKTHSFSYPFKTMGLEGVTIQNPQITIMPDPFLDGIAADMILGMDVLRQTHLYIAYGEKKLYLTTALAH
jgi:predicted aspartyl protease